MIKRDWWPKPFERMVVLGESTVQGGPWLQRTEERFARAERLAMESPVKMLGPLILCIFPCAFLVIAFPIAHRLLQWA